MIKLSGEFNKVGSRVDKAMWLLMKNLRIEIDVSEPTNLSETNHSHSEYGVNFPEPTKKKHNEYGMSFSSIIQSNDLKT